MAGEGSSPRDWISTKEQLVIGGKEVVDGDLAVDGGSDH